MPYPNRPLTILLAALGGEGGGVLADWLVEAAQRQDLPVQSTSIPGVAQRTGATTYYIEIYPVPVAQLGGRRPVLALTPSPSNIDVMAASELVEAGRAMQNGYISPRTTLVASTHRIYATVEKMQMGDGRYDAQRIVDAAPQLAGKTVLFDMAAATQEAGTVVSAVMFGAIIGAGTLPLTREVCEQVIRDSGKGVVGSLKGFAAGFAAATGGAPAGSANAVSVPGGLPQAADFPPAAQDIVAEGVKRLIDYQDQAYADLYRKRLANIARLDTGDGKLAAETARYLALWMSFEDLIRVADLKTRKSRFERVRADVLAKEDEPLHIVEFLKPGLDEISGMLPPAIALRFHAWATKNGLAEKLSFGMHIKTNSILGFLLLRVTAGMRFWRRRTSRYAEEQALIERWLKAVETAAARDLKFAYEIALTARLVKGYGDTNKRGKASFRRIFDNLVEGEMAMDDAARARAIFAAREAALADPEGRNLEKTLGTHGIKPLPPREQPVRFIKPTVKRG
ncbi:MAG TPA: indolepyruvate oxidoreductase subunit beta family protein [Burkholderiales bacterium]|jgi:indolepyruvate ferredoxin oxidoreductase beta subunit